MVKGFYSQIPSQDVVVGVAMKDSYPVAAQEDLATLSTMEFDGK